MQISTLGAVGSIDCFLTSTSATQIQCRVDTTTNKTAGTSGKMITFLKTSEEAVCVPNDTCAWTYSGTIPTVTGIVSEYSTTTNAWTVKVTGTAFTGTTSTVELVANGASQTTTSVSTTEAVFTISNVTSSSLSNMFVYFDVGLPEGHHSIVNNSTLSLTP